MRKSLIVLSVLLLTLILAAPVLAAGTPPWWDNPGGAYTSWHSKSTTGTIANSGGETQLTSIIFDVPNECPAGTTQKQVWQQISWTVTGGAASLQNSPRTIEWSQSACPASTSDPFDADDDANMTLKGAFTPSGYDNGQERSGSLVDTSAAWSPKCERIWTTFQVGPGGSLNYKLEVQTVCLSPAAVTLSGLQARTISPVERLSALLQSWFQR